MKDRSGKTGNQSSENTGNSSASRGSGSGQANTLTIDPSGGMHGAFEGRIGYMTPEFKKEWLAGGGRPPNRNGSGSSYSRTSGGTHKKAGK